MFGILKKLILLSGLAFGGSAVYVGLEPEAREAVMTELAALAAQVVSLWGNVKENPVPYLTATITFVVMFTFNKVKGLSTRDSALSAATRLTVVAVEKEKPTQTESPVVARAKARATQKQLESDLAETEGKIKNLPAKIKTAEQESAWAQAELEKAQTAYKHAKELAEAAEQEAVELRTEYARAKAEIEVIAANLQEIKAQAA